MGKLNGFLGIIAIMGLAYAMSTNRKAIKLRIVLWGLGLQWLFAFLVLKTPFFRVLEKIRDGGMKLLGYSEAGSSFVFGSLGGPANDKTLGLIFAFRVLPIIIFIASFFAVLYYLGVMQIVVKAFAKAMTYIMGASGAESLNVAASIFMGQTEAPLTIKPFLHDMTESELMTVMTCGMAHVSGAVMGAYVLIGKVDMLHLLTAVIMTAPATILMAKMFIPETGTPRTAGTVRLEEEPDKPINVIEAAGRGAIDGLHLALNIAAILIAFIALIALVNGLLGLIPAGSEPLSLERIFGWAFAPVAWLLGVTWKDASAVGSLLGTRLVINEFVAFQKLGPIKDTLDPRSFIIATYALCGFANFSSIGIQIGGIGSLAPNRRSDLARLGLKAVLAGTLANFMSAAIAGMLL
jgi:concentrative nucleoside transporter, CNT family